MVRHQGFLKLLIFYLGFSYFLLSSAVSTICSPQGILSSNEEHTSVHHELIAQGELDIRDGEVVLGKLEGRMEMEMLDYPGTGANNHHDPKAPGVA